MFALGRSIHVRGKGCAHDIGSRAFWLDFPFLLGADASKRKGIVMTDRTERAPSAFRLNLEQQKNRAKDLLRAAKAADATALSRFAAIHRAHRMPVEVKAQLKLADAQFVIARELRFGSWTELKAHAALMARQRAAIDTNRVAPDGDMKTLHIRCGSDIQQTLQDAGFVGDFLEHAIPYCMGPVTTGPDRHELMARFIVNAFPDAQGGLVYERELEGLVRGEQRLSRTGDDYERIVLWAEHDVWDQLFLARMLAHYEHAKRPRVLELIAVNEFPGGERFIGLGQLPAEALRLLWSTRKSVTDAQLSLGHAVWSALASDNPQRLAALAHSGTPALPIMAPALHRHLRELPSVENGLSLTEHLVLQILSEGSTTLNRVHSMMTTGDPLSRSDGPEATRVREPLRWIGDLGMLHVVNEMLTAEVPVLVRTPPAAGERWFHQRLSITDAGLAVLRGQRDWHSLKPLPRWVGGVHVEPGLPAWRWDEVKQKAVQR